MHVQAEPNQIQSNPVFSCESSREHSLAAAWVRALIRASVCRTASSSGLRPGKDLARLEEYRVNVSPFLTCGGRVLTHASSVSSTAAVNLANSDLRDSGDGAEQGKACRMSCYLLSSWRAKKRRLVRFSDVHWHI
jgi:ribosomal protein L40E